MKALSFIKNHKNHKYSEQHQQQFNDVCEKVHSFMLGKQKKKKRKRIRSVIYEFNFLFHLNTHTLTYSHTHML